MVTNVAKVETAVAKLRLWKKQTKIAHQKWQRILNQHCKSERATNVAKWKRQCQNSGCGRNKTDFTNQRGQ